MMQDILKKAV